MPAPVAGVEAEFRIAAGGAFHSPDTRILKSGDSFAVLGLNGDMSGGQGSPDGLYHCDTRFLSQLELRLNGDRPLLLSSTPAEDGTLASVHLETYLACFWDMAVVVFLLSPGLLLFRTHTIGKAKRA